MNGVQHLMGTVFTITAYDSGVDAGAIDAAFEWLHWVDRIFSTFREDSEISLIGRGELSLDDTSSEVRHVLSRCGELENETGHRFSIRPESGREPRLDPAGFVKGWSVDEAALILRVAGVTRFMIDAGGDVLCVGEAPTDGGWTVGVRHPDQPEKMGVVLTIPEGAAATSGTYIRGEHIWGSGLTERSVTSVTVVGPSLGVADALATAIFGDQASSLSFMSRFPDYGVALMTADHQLRWTEPLDGAVDVVDQEVAMPADPMAANFEGHREGERHV